jgi:hypothetical protein
MTGFVPVIHAVMRSLTSMVFRSGAAWVAGTSPAMTEAASYVGA